MKLPIWIMLQVPMLYCLAFDFSDPTIPANESQLFVARPLGFILWAAATAFALWFVCALSRARGDKPVELIDGTNTTKREFESRLWPFRRMCLALCCLTTASQASAFDLIDSRGSNVTTRGQDALIVIGQDFCVPLKDMVPALAGLKRDYPLEVFVLLPCDGAPVASNWVADLPSAASLCVCDVTRENLVLDLWSAVGYAQPAAFMFDSVGTCRTNWLHYQTRTALEPAIARATIRLRSVPYGVAWPVSPLAPRLESSGDLVAWFQVPSSLITQAAGDNRAFYTNARQQFYRLRW